MTPIVCSMKLFTAALVALLLCYASNAHANPDDECQDSDERFVLYVDSGEGNVTTIIKTCFDAKSDPLLCDIYTMKEACPKTCGMCVPTGIPPGGHCVLDLKLGFPWMKSVPGVDKFYASDTMLVKETKLGTVCSSFKPETGWGCALQGEAFVEYSTNDPDHYKESIEYDQEHVRISNAAGSSYRVQVRHRFTSKEVHQKPLPLDDIDMRSKLSIKVNNQWRKTFKNRGNSGIPTHILPDEEEWVFPIETEPTRDENLVPSEDDDETTFPKQDPDLSGYINPMYKGSYFVDIECNDNCKCTFKRRKAKCEVTAKLLPDISNFSRREKLIVRKEGTSGPSCSRENPESWYCAHYGNAKAFEAHITDYAIANQQAAAVKIADAASSTYMFTLHREKNIPEDGHPFSLFIYMPGKTYGPLSLVEAGANFSWRAWGLSCDQFCNCDEPFELPTVQ